MNSPAPFEGNREKDPTYPPPPGIGLAPVLDRNIEALRARRTQEKKTASWEERLADVITAFAGSMLFVYIHIAVFGFWLIANLKWIPFIPAWDESFVILAMVGLAPFSWTVESLGS